MSLKNDLIKHQVFVQRLVGTEAKAINSHLEGLKQRAKFEIAAGTSGKQLKENLRSALNNLPDSGIKNMVDFAEYESQFSAKVFKRNLKIDVSTVDRDVLEKTLKTNNMEINNISRKGTRKSLYAAYSQFANRKADEISQVIRDAQIKGLSMSETSALVEERINGLQKAQARILASTAINYTTNVARLETLAENKKTISDKVIWVSVLDNSTTDYCSDHDGNVYGVDDGPRPPAHWGCRSHVEPYIE